MKGKFILGFAILIFLLGGVFAATTFGGSSGSYSYSSAQYTQPGLFSVAQSPSNFYSLYPQYDSSVCQASQDFVLIIPPGGCSPPVVRSDLLAEQNVNVFCKIQAVQINPSIRPEIIRAIVPNFVGSPPDGVIGVDYYRPKYVGQTGVNQNEFPWFDNVGYVVIKLQRQPDERNVSNFIQGNLSMRVTYSSTGGLGYGFSEYTIPVLTDDEWAREYVKYSFLNGQGFVRVDSITDTQAVVSIYTEKDRQITTFAVKNGETSTPKYLPGSYCGIGYKVSYIKSEQPKTKAVIYFDVDMYSVYEGGEIGEFCRATKITSTGSGTGEVTISCVGMKPFILSTKLNDVVLRVGAEYEKTYNIGETLYSGVYGDAYLASVGKYFSGGNFVVLIDSELTLEDNPLQRELSNVVAQVSANPEFNPEEQKIGEKNVTFIVIGEGKSKNVERSDGAGSIDVNFTGFKTAEVRDYGSDFNTYFSQAKKQYEEIDNVYADLEIKIDDNDERAGYWALFKAFELAKDTNQDAAAVSFANMLEEKYGDSYAKNYLNSIAGWDNKNAENIFTLNADNHVIRLDSVIAPGLDESSIEIVVNGEKKIYSGAEQVQVLADGNGSLEIKSFTNEKIRVEVVSKENDCSEQKNKELGEIALGRTAIICRRTITVNKINLEQNARIKVEPITQRDGFVTNMSFGIGIEERAIQLSPEKAAERIKKLNESIADLEKLNENLGKVVETMKTACFATSAALQVKNLFSNLGGGAIARQKVMQGESGEGGWNDLCAQVMAEGGKPSQELIAFGVKDMGYANAEDCIMKNSDAIENEVNFYKTKIEEYNNAAKAREEAAGVVSSGGLLDGKSIDAKGAFAAHADYLEEKYGKEGEIIDPTGKGQPVNVGEVIKDLNYSYATNADARELGLMLDVINSDDVSERIKKQTEKQLYEKVSELNNLKISDPASVAGEAIDKGFVAGDVQVDALQRNQGPARVYNGATFGSAIAVDTAGNSVSISGQPVHITTFGDTKYYIQLKRATPDSSQYLVGKKFIEEEDGELKEIDCNSPSLENKQACDIINRNYGVFMQLDGANYHNKYKDPEVKYHESGQNKGMPAIVPFDTTSGWYVATKPLLSSFGSIPAYQESGVPSSFSICNVGKNGREEFSTGLGDDICRQFDVYTGQPLDVFPGLETGEAKKLVSEAVSALEDAARQYKSGVTSVTINGKSYKVGNPAANLPGTRCTDFMSPKDCKLMFQVCDPVICPSSRCNLGGKYYVDDVVQTGIVGSVFLCLPNYKEGIFIPICLTGIHAGIDNWVSILKSYRDCLQESIDSGEYTGICDEITAVYKCEFFWKQITPLINNILPKLLESLTGKGSVRGGGEYLTVPAAWSNMQQSISYFTNFYGGNAFNAYKIRSTAEAGTEICKGFVSIAYPNKLKSLIEPDSPSQFSAWFTEIPQTTATVPAISQYKVFYHIFAGNDQGVQYSVYLKDIAGPSYYAETDMLLIANSFVAKGEYVSETIDRTAPSNFQQLCVRINADEECGFKQVSTSFALNYVSDNYVQDELEQTDIRTEGECISGTSNALALVQPNIQAGTEELISPQIYDRGVIRVCSTNNPGENVEPTRWVKVGICGQENMGCWLDKQSVTNAIGDENIGAKNATLEYLDSLTENAQHESVAKPMATQNDLLNGFGEIQTSINELQDEVNELTKEDSLFDVKTKSSEAISKISAFENKYSLTSAQEARLQLYKAQVYDLVARGAFRVYKKTIAGVDVTETPLATPETYGQVFSKEGIESVIDAFIKGCGEEGCKDPFAEFWDTTINKEGFERVMESAMIIGVEADKPFISLECGPYLDKIFDVSQEEEVDPLLIATLIFYESGCDANAVSTSDAYGLMQITEGTFGEICKNKIKGIAEFTDIQGTENVRNNIKCGIEILKAKKDYFKVEECAGDVECKHAFSNPASANGEAICSNRKCYYAFKCDRLWYTLWLLKRTKYYPAGWTTALRGYNGWACNDDNAYAENIAAIYGHLQDRKLTLAESTPATTVSEAKKICLDAGHGDGINPEFLNILGIDRSEGTNNREIVEILKYDLEDAGYEVILTRPGIEDVLILNRVDTANKANCDILISIHSNAFNSNLKGTETYVRADTTALNYVRGEVLAEYVHPKVFEAFGSLDRGIKLDTESQYENTENTGLGILRGTNMPAILIEIGFHDNPEDVVKLVDPDVRNKVADAIVQGVNGYFK